MPEQGGLPQGGLPDGGLPEGGLPDGPTGGIISMDTATINYAGQSFSLPTPSTATQYFFGYSVQIGMITYQWGDIYDH